MIHCHKKILWTAAILLTLTTGCTGAKYGVANTSDTATRIPKTTTPIMDYWMRDTWITFGPDGYYYMVGTTADPQRKFEGQVHCWDWNDGLYLFRSTNLGDWDSMGRIWALDKDGSWQKSLNICSRRKACEAFAQRRSSR